MTEPERRVRRPEVVVELRVNRPGQAAVTSEQHLGDRLAAFVDGELDHDARERVQSHLAGCAACLARAEEERGLKARLSAAAAPDPSTVLMSRLMAISLDGDREGPGPGPRSGPQGGRGVFGGPSLGGGHFGGSSGFGSSLFGRGALGADNPLPGVDPRAERSGGLPFRGQQRPIAARMDEGARRNDRSAERPGPEAAPQPVRAPAPASLARGRRFAFAAAGAFSVAAVALGSAVTGVTAAGTTVEEPYGSVTPVADPGGVGGAGLRPDQTGRLTGRSANSIPMSAANMAGGSGLYSAPQSAAGPTASPSSTPLGATAPLSLPEGLIGH
ncbi:anti-sigma factor family protein [Streptacidiphilus albus]|uniref:anti-sigma factor family protein n=1 Tax=Streptacidiphilus albus TaxID=105425 RepID=UPI0006941C0A|nr:anti-sigma factor [Streptacidiphilus albus]